MNLRRLAATLLLAAAALTTTPAPALAHTELKSSDPAEGAALATAPTQIVLTFNDAVTLPADPIAVTGPDGSLWTVGKATVAAAVVTAPVRPTGPAGAYKLTYRVVADDGDLVSGTVTFTLSNAATPTTTTTTPPPTTTTQAPTTTTAAPAPAATSTEDTGIPAWVWIGGAVVIVGVGVFVGLRARRSK
ncbi:copper resistance CopC family protein [Actinokineospora sp.]|uniref:copper resistance CopC family protein n=1 Tax=Actinokineospora sp. TaxID=1872133 RepID=UPI0040382F84